MKKILLILFAMLSSSIIAQSIYTQEDVDVCKSKFELALSENLVDKPIYEVIIDIGKSFLGTDYVAHSLEQGETENLVIHLTGLDCYTFLESSLVFARCIKMGKITFDDFQKEISNVRYRGGMIKEYPSRLHYFSDWIFDLSRRSIVKDMTKEIGGIPYENKVNFMSTHPSAYARLVDNPKFIEQMNMIEQMIGMRDYYYIPQSKIQSVEDKILSGDIIGITTGIEGLDIIHTGIAIRMDDGRIHFMHSPNVGKKVQITDIPLADYIKKNKSQTGIMVVRAIEPVK